MKRIIPVVIVLLLCFSWLQGCEDDTSQGCDGDTPTDDTSYPPKPSEEVDSAANPLVAQGPYFRDSQGGVVFLRGVNVAGNSKVPPFTGITSKSELEKLPALGVNTLRLLFTWEAFEPEKGEYSEDYLAYYQRVVRWADQLNLYVIVDFHQDAYSRYSLEGCGEGFPPWALTPEVQPAVPDNGESCSSWGIQMILDASLATTWSHFHSDKYGAKGAYLDMVEKVAKEMAAFDNIIGYELINEPWGSDEELFTLFQQVGHRIRNQDRGAVLFVPAHALVSGGTREDTIDMPDFDNMVYSPHYYNGAVLFLKSWGGADPSGQLDKLKSKADTWEVPMLLSEFGAPAGTRNGLNYIAAQLDWLDKYWVSSTQWNFTPGWREDVKDGWNMEDLSIVDDQGVLRDNFIVRPYPQRVGGAPKGFTLTDEGFSLAWNNHAGWGSTIVFLPEGYADDKNLKLELSEGVNGACRVEDSAVICDINGSGETEVSIKR